MAVVGAKFYPAGGGGGRYSQAGYRRRFSYLQETNTKTEGRNGNRSKLC